MSSHNLYEYEATVLKIRKGYMDAAQGLCDDLREIAGEYIETITLDADTITIEWKQEIDFEIHEIEEAGDGAWARTSSSGRVRPKSLATASSTITRMKKSNASRVHPRKPASSALR